MQKADRDVAALTVLGLLKTGPRHLYEMNLLIVRTHKTFVTGLPRSIYHAAERLVAAGHIRVAATLRDGVRPERTVYELTGSGEQRLRDWVRLLLAEPDPTSGLLVPALTFAGCLRPADVADALRARHTHLTDRQRTATATIPPGLPRILLLEAEYEIDRLRAETAWITRIVADLDAGALDWPADLTETADLEELLKEN